MIIFRATLALMWPFRQPDTTDHRAAAKPADVVETAVDREAEAHQHVVKLHVELTELDRQMREFKTAYRVSASKFGVLLGCQCGLSERPAIEAKWKSLLTARDRLVSEWHQALHKWSDLKGQTT